MNISLSPEAERIIRQKLQAGQYSTPEDVVLAGLAALEQQPQEDFAPGELEALIAEGEASLQKEGAIPAEEVFEQIREMSRQRRERKP